MGFQNADPVMVDLSFLLSAEGLEWVENQRLLDETRVPAALRPWLENELDFDFERLVAPDDRYEVPERRERIALLLTDEHYFAGADVQLADAHREVWGALIGRAPGPVGDLWADEWAFLASQSILLSKLRHPVNAIREAGATIVEFGRKVGRDLLEEVIPEERIDEEARARIVALGVAKWVLVGGAHIGGGTLGGLVGALAGPAGAVVGEKLFGEVAGELARSALLAVDP